MRFYYKVIEYFNIEVYIKKHKTNILILTAKEKYFDNTD